MAYGDFRDLNKRKFADKVLRDKAFNIAKDFDGSQKGLTSGSGIKNDNISNKELAEDLYKPIIT